MPKAQKSPDEALRILSDPKVKSIVHEAFPGWYTRSFATVVYHFTGEEIEMRIVPYSRNPSEEILVRINPNREKKFFVEKNKIT